MTVQFQPVEEIHERIVRMQRELEREMVRATVGGVTVLVNGCQHIESVQIAPDVADRAGANLGNLIAEAVNVALDKARAMTQQRITALTDSAAA